jgi:hypothetical protein
MSGDPELFVRIVEPLGHRAKERDAAFLTAYDAVVNRFVRELMADFSPRI